MILSTDRPQKGQFDQDGPGMLVWVKIPPTRAEGDTQCKYGAKHVRTLTSFHLSK